MATITPTVTQPGKRRIRVVWANLSSNDVGGGVDISRYADKTAQVDITTVGSGTLEMQGSMDASNWSALKEPDGTALTGLNTDNDTFSILENPTHIRPNVGGSGGARGLHQEVVLR